MLKFPSILAMRIHLVSELNSDAACEQRLSMLNLTYRCSSWCFSSTSHLPEVYLKKSSSLSADRYLVSPERIGSYLTHGVCQLLFLREALRSEKCD